MLATYKIELTGRHYATALTRFRRQSPDYWRNQMLPFAALFFSAAAAVFAALTDSNWEGLAIGLAVSGIFVALILALLQRAVIRKNIRRTPTFGERVTIILDEHGARSIAREGTTHIDWKSFTSATRFTDGFVLSQGSLNSWLPNSALQEATPEQVEALLRSKVPTFVLI